MEAISYITGWTKWLLIIIPVAAGTMCTYHALRKTMTSDDSVISECNSKISNTIKGAIIGMTISGLITLLRTFYG